MADFAQITAKGLYSKNADFSNPSLRFNWSYAPATANVDEYRCSEVEVDTGGTSISLANFSSISGIAIRNTHATATIRAVWHNARGSGSFADMLTFGDASTGDTINRTSSGTEFTAAAMDVVKGGYVRITGATDAANNSTFLVSSVTITAITLAPSETLDAGADSATVAIYSQEKNSQLIAGGGVLVIPDAVPEEGLTLTSSATAECEIFIVGT